jgi:pimeloyl-ACP methyl ester carboxylesterase
MAKTSNLPKPRGRMIDIGGGRRLHGVFAGPVHASCPLVVLEAGAFGFSADWSAVQDKLAKKGIRSLAYDRAGLGFSDPGPLPRDGVSIASDLEAFLARTNESGPLVACGHSMAGLHVRLFTARNSGRVVGLVLIDATTPEAMESVMVSGFVDQFAKVSRLAAWGAGAGLFKPFSGTPLGDAIGLEGAPGTEKRWAFAAPIHNRWASAEVDCWATSARQAMAAGSLDPQLPVAVILAGGGGERGGIRALQTAPAEASRFGFVEQVKGSSHATLLSGAFADAVVRGIEHVRRAADVAAS